MSALTATEDLWSKVAATTGLSTSGAVITIGTFNVTRNGQSHEDYSAFTGEDSANGTLRNGTGTVSSVFNTSDLIGARHITWSGGVAWAAAQRSAQRSRTGDHHATRSCLLA